MNKMLMLLFACCLQVTVGLPQAAIDKNKVLDFFQNQQYEDAVHFLLPTLINDSTNLQLLGFLGHASYMNANIAEAKKYYQQIITLDSNNINANQYLATISGNTDPLLSQQYTRRLINLQPGNATHYRNMGNLFKKLNQKDAALQFYGLAYQRAPRDPKNGIVFSDALIEKKSYLLADSIIDKGLTPDSLNIAYLKLRIRSAYEAKDYQHAVLPGETLLRLGEISQGAFTQLAICYYNLGKYNDCIRVCEWMLGNDLDGETIYYYEARAQAKLKNFVASNELFQVCLSKAISKTAELYYYNLGENYEAMHRFSTAVKQYDSAFYLFKNPLMKYYTARIYENNVRQETTPHKYYRQYLAIAKPETPDEKKAYEYIKSEYGGKK